MPDRLAAPPQDSASPVLLTRFAAALVLLVLIALAGAGIENQRRALERERSLQQFRRDELQWQVAQRRLDVERLQTPVQLRQAAESADPLADAQ